MNQVITISPDGAISGLQHKKGKGVDLRVFGHAQIERASLIEWHEGKQAWWVHIVAGRYTGEGLSYNLRRDTVGVAPGEAFYPGSTITAGAGAASICSGMYYFADYDDAVAAEVDFLNALRLAGIF